MTSVRTHTSASSLVQPSSMPATVMTAISLPEDLNPVPSEMAADPLNGGVWFWSEVGPEAKLVHVSDSGTAKEYDIGDALTVGLLTADLTPIAVGSDGTVWMAAGSTVVRFVPASGAVTAWSIDSTGGSSGGTPQRGITSISLNPTGSTVAIAVNDGEVSLLSVANGTFSTPPGSLTGAPVSVAYLSDGTLEVGSLGVRGVGGEVESIRPDSQIESVADATQYLTPDGTSVLAAGGNLSLVDGSSSTTLATSEAGDLYLNERVAVTSMGDIVVPSVSGLAIMSSSGVIEDTLDLPEFSCPGVSEPGVSDPGLVTSSTLSSSSPECPQSAEAVAVGSVGTLYFFTSGPAAVLESVAASSLPTS